MSFKANLKNFANAQESNQDGGEDDNDDDDDIIKKGDVENEEFDDNPAAKSSGLKNKDGKYVPPKIKPVYNGNNSTES